MPDVPVLDLVGSGARVVFRRELKAYFLSPIAYVFGALFLAAQLYFTVAYAGVIDHGRPANLSVFFGLLPTVFLLFLPGLSMRLWAEERKLGTIELLMTFPVRPGSLIFGKFFAALGYLALLLLLTLGLPWTLDVAGDLDWKPVVGGYLASLLLAGSYLSVGMFFSSLTRDQIVAMLTSLVALALFVAPVTPRGVVLMEQAGLPTLAVQFLRGISPFEYFQSISRGVLDIGDLVCYAAFCGFFLHLNAMVLRGRRERG